MSQECPYCQTVVNDDDMEMHGYTCRDTPFMFRETAETERVKNLLETFKTKLINWCNPITSEYAFANISDNTSTKNFPCVECDTFQEHLSGGCVRSLNIIYFKGEAQITVQRILNLLARYIDLAADHYHRKLDDLRCKALEIDRFMTADIALKSASAGYMHLHNGLAIDYMLKSMQIREAFSARKTRMLELEESKLRRRVAHGVREISSVNRTFLREQFGINV